MVLLDSNIIIYLSQNIIDLDDIADDDSILTVSVITYIEVLGYPFSDETQRAFIKKLFSFLEIIYIDESIAQKTIELRENNKIKLPDAIICATALRAKAKLITNDERLRNLYSKYS